MHRSLTFLLAIGATLFLSGCGMLDWFRRGNPPERLAYGEVQARASNAMEEAARLRERGALRSAAMRYRQIARRYPRAAEAPEALFLSAEIQRERGRTRLAFDLYQELVRRYPQFPKFDQVVEGQFSIAEGTANRKRRILFVFPYRNWDLAIEQYERVIINAPYSERAPQSLLAIANLSVKRRDRDTAIDALDRFINDYPQNASAPGAYFQLAQTYRELVDGPRYDQASTRQSITFFTDYLILYPDDPQVPEAEAGLAEMKETYARSKLLLGEYYLRFRKNRTAARVFLNQAITEAPESPSAARAREVLARIEAMPEPQPRAERAPKPEGRRNWWWPFGRRRGAADDNRDQPLGGTTETSGDRPNVAGDALEGADPAAARRGVGRLLGGEGSSSSGQGGGTLPPPSGTPTPTEPEPKPAPTPNP